MLSNPAAKIETRTVQRAMDAVKHGFRPIVCTKQ
jgi:hypothetical protein